MLNEPGKSNLDYRLDTHAGFLTAMADRMRRQPELRLLALADTSDPTLALADAWATVLDVLSFYQERVANEGFLRTATEQLSLRALGRTVDYALNPGVAAETYLVFTLDDSPGATAVVRIDVGSRVQSVPGPDEQAQIFETVEPLDARPDWNALYVDQTQPMPLVHETSPDTYTLYVQGASISIRAGDGLLMQPGPVFGHILAVTPDAEHGRTALTLDPGVDWPAPTCVYAFHLRAALFGHNAPNWAAMPDPVRQEYCRLANQDVGTTAEWPHFAVLGTAPADTIQLDALYPQLCPGTGTWVVLVDAQRGISIRQITRASESACADFTLATSTTCVTLDSGAFEFDRRQTLVFADSYPLQVAPAPLTAAVPEDTRCITLDRAVEHLYVGQCMIVVGVADADSSAVAQRVTLTAVRVEPTSGHTVLEFVPGLSADYRRADLTVYANVARATHGETVEEVLGSGVGAAAFARFDLRRAPLTYVPASTATGGESTLCVRVNDIPWSPVRSLASATAVDRVYTTETDGDGQPGVRFGDGVHGARLPSGDENVTARYRIGLGLAGNVRPDQLRVLLSYPLGVRSVTNPLAGASGADAEGAADARQNVPRSVYTLDRAVTLRDYAEFARAFGGIARARADWLSDGLRGVVVISVLGPDGQAVADDTLQRLVDALESARDPAQHVVVLPGQIRRFAVAARILLNSGCLAAPVRAAAQASIRTTFDFAYRDFGQDLTESAILDCLQTVPGVRAVDLETPMPGARAWDSEHHQLAARVARLDAAVQIQPAEILLLDPSPDAVVVRDVLDFWQPEVASA